MNGFQSPVKNAARPSASALNTSRSPHSQSSMPYQSTIQPPLQSPHGNFPPSANGYGQQAVPSPVKSSPAQPPPQQWQPPQHQQHQLPPHLAHTPQQSFRSPAANGANTSLQTPQHLNPSPAGANANAVAADGMSGPWPENSKVIPQKHDQSPAPPGPPVHHRQGSETKFPPPVALVPSPDHAAQAQAVGPQSVPVKKMPEANGTHAGPSAQFMEGKGVALSPAQHMAPSPGPVVNGTPTHAPGMSMAQLADQQQQQRPGHDQGISSNQPPQ